VGIAPGQSSCSRRQSLQHLGVVASTWPDATARQTAAAIYKGQLGVQLSDLTVWVSNSMTPGDWLPNPRANGIVIGNNGVTTAKANPDGDIVGTSASQVLANKTLNAPTINNPVGMTPADVGLGNIDDTSDLDKPISTATALALSVKEDKANKGNVNGYPPLDITGKIPPEYLPGGGTGGTVYGERGTRTRTRRQLLLVRRRREPWMVLFRFSRRDNHWMASRRVRWGPNLSIASSGRNSRGRRQ
jgi:hypothetical protein